MNENAAIDMLNDEHRYILMVVDGLRQIAVALREGRAVEVDMLKEAVDFMRVFADETHHGKEEDLLFPAFVDHGVPLHGCPMDALLHEHRQGRELVKRIAEGAEAYASGKPEAPEEIATAIDGVVKLYPNHIWKEEEMVFPMAERMFPTELRNTLFRQFKDVDADHLKGNRAKFQQFAERISMVS